MKNFKILAVAAALSAVMTGSAFAVSAYHGGQVLPISTTLNSTVESYAEVQSEHVEIANSQVLNTAVLAKVNNLPENSIIYDAASVNTGELKFSDGEHSFQAVAYESGDRGHVVSAGGELPTTKNTYVTKPGDVINISPVSNLDRPAVGVYTSNPTVYTWKE
ncbi:hypothetical protein PQY08_004342 [Salmonella enterica]|nr:hypothetical protein [Salmonella enterica]ECC3214305.1 hypothetical protein [Salmonella enterica subsp. diarizonae]EBL8185183.1 hypothetical protein [Salmonella enterica]EDQ3623999.1 hypothetical protein [Salmonella enterica subsp. diarizonae]EHW7085874.1 hypothetical protein [Salmonella enterica]